MVNRIVVGAHYGLQSWLLQRVSAVIMVAYVIVMAIIVSGRPDASFTAWKGIFSQGWVRLATLLFVISVLLHAWVGVRDIFMDYVKCTGLRLTLQVLTILWLVGCAGWALQVLWRI